MRILLNFRIIKKFNNNACEVTSIYLVPNKQWSVSLLIHFTTKKWWWCKILLCSLWEASDRKPSDETWGGCCELGHREVLLIVYKMRTFLGSAMAPFMPLSHNFEIFIGHWYRRLYSWKKKIILAAVYLSLPMVSGCSCEWKTDCPINLFILIDLLEHLAIAFEKCQ